MNTEQGPQNPQKWVIFESLSYVTLLYFKSYSGPTANRSPLTTGERASGREVLHYYIQYSACDGLTTEATKIPCIMT
jgi:hypothetical protein